MDSDSKTDIPIKQAEFEQGYRDILRHLSTEESAAHAAYAKALAVQVDFRRRDQAGEFLIGTFENTVRMTAGAYQRYCATKAAHADMIQTCYGPTTIAHSRTVDRRESETEACRIYRVFRERRSQGARTAAPSSEQQARHDIEGKEDEDFTESLRRAALVLEKTRVISPEEEEARTAIRDLREMLVDLGTTLRPVMGPANHIRALEHLDYIQENLEKVASNAGQTDPSQPE
jgi:hypothetical protein